MISHACAGAAPDGASVMVDDVTRGTFLVKLLGCPWKLVTS